jgi:hypothetical protein
MFKPLRAAAASRWGCGTAGNPIFVERLLDIKVCVCVCVGGFVCVCARALIGTLCSLHYGPHL